MTVAGGDAIALLRTLVRIDSRNPGLVPGAPGEGEVAHALTDILRAWGFRVALMEAAPGRPNVVARIGAARAGAPALMFNGHLDVVDVERMTHAPFEAFLAGGRIYGRGATDMKGGVAAMCAAAWRAANADPGISGEIVVTAVVDEEFESAGTRALLKSGVRADAAIVTEPTKLAIAPAHRGFTWIEVVVRGRAAHGSRYDVGIDAIRHAGLLLAELDRVQDVELVTHTHPLLGHASLHAATIEGGVGWSTYPASCTVRLERRTLPGERPDDAVEEVRAACARVQRVAPTFDASVSYVFSQEPSDVATDAPVVSSLRQALVAEKEAVTFEGLSAWTDAALFNAAGIPAICYGPGDISMAHSAEEWVSTGEVERATRVLTRMAGDWCGSA